MKNKYLFAIIPGLLFVVSFGSSCKKEGAAQTTIIPKDTIAYQFYYPSKLIDSCGGKYLLDLDLDGLTDIQIGMVCTSGPLIMPLSGGPWYFDYTYSVNLDTILNSKITFLSKASPTHTTGMDFFRLNDTISPPYSLEVRSGNMMSYESKQYPGRGISVLTTGPYYFGFRKTDSTGDKYGWIKISCDARSNLYLDGVAINNALGKPILAGQY